MTMHLFNADEIKAGARGEWLKAPSADFHVKSVKTDTRQDCTGSLFVALVGDNFNAHDMLDKAVEAKAAAICIGREYSSRVQPEWNIPVLLVDDTLDAYQDLAAFHKRRFPELRTVAVTGSVGKTSIKEIVRSILVAAAGEEGVLATEGNTNNQIGVPQNLLKLNPNHRFAVIEMGTNHHGEIEPLSRCAAPDVAIVGSIAPCHLEFLGDLNGVAREKSKIYSNLNPDGTAIYPENCAGNEILSLAAAPYMNFCFGTDENADFRAIYHGGNLHGSSIELFMRPYGCSIKVDWKLPGAHQALNAAAASAAAASLGIPVETIAEGLRKCSLPGMRMAVVERDGVVWINDAYNANSGSMKAALHWLAEFADPARLMLVLGDMGELGSNSDHEHQEVLKTAFELFPGTRFRLIGKNMAAAWDKLGLKGDVKFFADSTAAREIHGEVAAGMTVLLKGSRFMRLEKILPE